MVSLPYLLREGQVAYARKVMANFEALLGAYNQATVKGLGTGAIPTLMELLYQAVVKAGEDGNSNQILFNDGESLQAKFDVGNLYADLAMSDGMFYFEVNPLNGHLMVTSSTRLEEDAFYIDEETGHLIYNIDDPATNTSFKTFDLGLVQGPPGPAGEGGDMYKAVYDPDNLGDPHPYTGWFSAPAVDWGAYFLTYDTEFEDGKTYYTESEGVYTEAEVTVGADVPVNSYYEKLPRTDLLLTDLTNTGGALLSDHIGPVSGHTLAGPAQLATDEAKLAWAAATVVDAGQGAGNTATGATNTSSWIRLRALGTVPETDIPLMLTFYK